MRMSKPGRRNDLEDDEVEVDDLEFDDLVDNEVEDYEIEDYDMVDGVDGFDLVDNEMYPEDGLMFTQMDDSIGEYLDLFSEFSHDSNGFDEEHIMMDFL